MSVESIKEHPKYRIQTAHAIWLPDRYIKKTDYLNDLRYSDGAYSPFDPPTLGLKILERRPSAGQGELIHIATTGDWLFTRNHTAVGTSITVSNTHNADRVTLSFYVKPPLYTDCAENYAETPVEIDLAELTDFEQAQQSLQPTVMQISSRTRFTLAMGIEFMVPLRSFKDRESAYSSLRERREIPARLEINCYDNARGPFFPCDPLLCYSREMRGSLVVEPSADGACALYAEMAAATSYRDLPAQRLSGEINAQLRRGPVAAFAKTLLPDFKESGHYWETPLGPPTAALLQPLWSALDGDIADQFKPHLTVDGMGSFIPSRPAPALQIIQGGRAP